MTVLHIVVAMKPVEGSYAENALASGVAGLNIDGSRVATDEEIGRDNTGIKGSILNKQSGWNDNSMVGLDRRGLHVGRWPANVIHDGSDEIKAEFPDTGQPCGSKKKTTHDEGMFGIGTPGQIYKDKSNTADRFFKECKV